MKNTKLVQLLSTFSRTELLDFERVLKNSGFQKGNPIFRLFHILKKAHPTFKPKKIEKKVVFDYVFEKKKGVNIRRLTDVISHLNLAAQNYLIDKKLYEKEAIRNLTLLEIYEERKLDKLFFSTSQQLLNKWEKKPLPGRSFYGHQFDLYSIYCYHPHYTSTQRKEINIGSLLEASDLNYFIEKLYLTNLLENNKQSLTSEDKNYKENIFIDAILEEIEQRNLTEIPIVFILKELIESRRLGVYDNYPELKHCFLESIDKFTIKEQYDILGSLQRYCYENYHRGDTKALEEIHKLNILGVERNIYILGGFIPDHMFRAIVQIACAVYAFEWVEEFLKNYGDKLNETNRAEILILSKAIVLSRQEKYAAALQVLIHAKPQDIMYDIQIRCIRVQCYYELEDYEDTLDHFLNAFAALISRNKLLSPIYKNDINNFIRFTYHLIQAKNDPNRSFEKLQVKLNSYPQIAYKSWLTQKVAELR